SLWDAGADRASRADYVALPPGGVVLVSGTFLLGGGLPFDVVVHLELSPGALSRRTAPDLAWTLPAFARYADEVAPATFADLVVRADDARRPAIVESDDDSV
ncbi:uridine kinase, partial [Verrucosispora sp. SN26_14.1]